MVGVVTADSEGVSEFEVPIHEGAAGLWALVYRSILIGSRLNIRFAATLAGACTGRADSIQ